MQSMTSEADSCLQVTKTHQVAKEAALSTLLRIWSFGVNSKRGNLLFHDIFQKSILLVRGGWIFTVGPNNVLLQVLKIPEVSITTECCTISRREQLCPKLKLLVLWGSQNMLLSSMKTKVQSWLRWVFKVKRAPY